MNKKTHDYLTLLGFTHRKETGDDSHIYYDIGGCVSLKLENDETVSNLGRLCIKIADQYYDQGRETGKQDALYNIYQKLIDVVYK